MQKPIALMLALCALAARGDDDEALSASLLEGVYSSLAVDPGSATADGASAVAVTVTVRNVSGDPVRGRQVLLIATGTGNTLVQPSSTGADGIARGTLVSTVAETKSISAKLLRHGRPPVLVLQTASVRFHGLLTYALLFNTSTGDVSRTAPSGIPSGNAPFTLEAWAQNSGGTDGHVLTYGHDDDNNDDAALFHYQGNICLWRAGYEDICSSAAWPVDDLFHHVAVCWDGSTVTYFLDGKKVRSLPHTPLSYGVANFLRLGNSVALSGQQWNGMLDEIRISDVVRYTTDFTPEDRFTTDAHTSALFHFDEGTGTVAHDDSSNQNDVTFGSPPPGWVLR